jgi:ribosomal protein L11 methylase PrmA
MPTLVAILAIAILLICLLWMFVPAFYGLPPLSAGSNRIRAALRMAELQPGETLVDLGSGHGGVLVIAAREFGANAVGVEAGPIQNLISRINAIRGGVGSSVRIETGDFFQADLSRAHVVYAYLTSRYAERLGEKLLRELRPQGRVVTVGFELIGWEPVSFDREHLIRLYRK